MMMESSLTAGESVEAFLSTNPLFYSLNPAVLASIASKVQVKTYEAGESIVREGEIGDSFYLIKEGRVHVLKSSGEDELVLSELGVSEGFGEMSLLIDQPRSATVRAIGPTIALKLTKDDFSELMRGWPELASKMHRLVDERVSLLESLDNDEAKSKFRADRAFALEYADLNLIMELNSAAGGEEQMEHCYEVGQLAREMSRILCPMLSEEILFAGYLHEIGKVSLPRQLIVRERRGDALSDEERAKFSHVFQNSVKILEPNRDLHRALAFIGSLGETSYKDMPLEAQVLKVADDYLEMSSYNCRRLGVEESLQKIREGSGTKYNPRVVAALQKNVRLYGDIRVESQLNVMRMMVKALDIKDNYTYRHSMDVRDMSLMIVDRLGLDRSQREYMRISAELHDVGKIFIDEEILNAPRKLTDAEFDTMKTHAARSADLFRTVPGMYQLVAIVRAHHEKYNGTGYPDGLKGEEIPFLARVMTLADVWSALTTPRVYRLGDDGKARKFTPEKALSIMQEMADGHFDPQLFPIFESIVKEKFYSEQ
jgi:HD-GYP domain-containing protein (c-di-GMP phosphodiesterase class II)